MQVEGVEIQGPQTERSNDVLTPEAVAFVAELHRKFNPRRVQLLQARRERQTRLDQGEMPQFLPETRGVREGDWRVNPVPNDLQNRRVEITGPVDRKMVINALNSGAKCFMADFEDANSPTWENCVDGQWNLTAAIERRIDYSTPEGKEYKLNDQTAVLLVRPRGWHLVEKHFLVDGAGRIDDSSAPSRTSSGGGEPVSASLFDFGLYFFHNAKRLLEKGSGPFFYLPKLESHLEARLWNDVFLHAQEKLGLERGTIKATVLIETILAAFEMEEILYELREHSAGLNAGRWDYIFSAIKKFRNRPDIVFPDRAQIGMTVPFMRAYTELLVKTCHKRGAHAMGGMAAFIPSRRDPKVNETALKKVREDKVREANDGFDGTWVAHPDLIPVAMEVFDRVLGSKPNQVDRQRPEVSVEAKDLLNFTVPDAQVTEAGLRNNVDVGIQYISAWLGGNGAVAIHNLMEDAATAEISRSQVWQWVRLQAKLDDGRPITRELVERIVAEETKNIRELGRYHHVDQARELFQTVAVSEEFPEFLTLPAYAKLP